MMKLPYSLAKELKNAGYPQKHKTWLPEEVPYPTLSELIDAVGDNFASLVRENTNRWRVYGKIRETRYLIGSTPEEAVSALWLALHKGGV
jgi:hypothetical protein